MSKSHFKGVNMEIITWMVGGILLLNVIRLCLAIRQQKRIDALNRRSEGMQIVWNQMCEDMLTWIREIHDECRADTETKKATQR